MNALYKTETIAFPLETITNWCMVSWHISDFINSPYLTILVNPQTYYY